MVVIVGSGAGGGTLGNELAQKGVRVVILEAGARIENHDFVNDEWESFTQLAWSDMRTTSGTASEDMREGLAPGLWRVLSPASRWLMNSSYGGEEAIGKQIGKRSCSVSGKVWADGAWIIDMMHVLSKTYGKGV